MSPRLELDLTGWALFGLSLVFLLMFVLKLVFVIELICVLSTTEDMDPLELLEYAKVSISPEVFLTCCTVFCKDNDDFSTEYKDDS